MKIRDYLELRKEEGVTEVWWEGVNGQGILLYTGGPKDVKTYVKDFVAITQSIFDEMHQERT